MAPAGRIAAFVLALLLGAVSAAAARAQAVAPGDDLQARIDAAAPGQVLRLLPGRHAGPVRVRHPVSLVGERGAVIAGNGKGSVVVVEAPDVRIEGLEITGSGTDVPGMD